MKVRGTKADLEFTVNANHNHFQEGFSVGPLQTSCIIITCSMCTRKDSWAPPKKNGVQIRRGGTRNLYLTDSSEVLMLKNTRHGWGRLALRSSVVVVGDLYHSRWDWLP